MEKFRVLEHYSCRYIPLPVSFKQIFAIYFPVNSSNAANILRNSCKQCSWDVKTRHNPALGNGPLHKRRGSNEPETDASASPQHGHDGWPPYDVIVCKRTWTRTFSNCIIMTHMSHISQHSTQCVIDIPQNRTETPQNILPACQVYVRYSFSSL